MFINASFLDIFILLWSIYEVAELVSSVGYHSSVFILCNGRDCTHDGLILYCFQILGSG